MSQRAHLSELERKIGDLEGQLRLKDHEVERSRNLVAEKDKVSVMHEICADFSLTLHRLLILNVPKPQR